MREDIRSESIRRVVPNGRFGSECHDAPDAAWPQDRQRLEPVGTGANELIVRDEKMAQVIATADQVADSRASILITGESGTGKELLARRLHRKSPRRANSFISVNCAAIPETLLESELFGHEKGAFTGAVSRRIGKFEEAHGGTLLLDEISEMDGRLQAKLLRAIQERVVDRLGGAKPVSVDIRIIATSNKDLHRAARDRSFREDLLYRLNVVNLNIPPLRSRPLDILELADHFARKYAKASSLPLRMLSGEARRQLLAHRWPGNVRELENTIHRAVLLSSGDQIDSQDISACGGDTDLSGATREAAIEVEDAGAGELVGKTVAEVERNLILETLRHCLGNRTRAANILGISIRTLRNKLRHYADAGMEIPMPCNAPAIAS